MKNRQKYHSSVGIDMHIYATAAALVKHCICQW